MRCFDFYFHKVLFLIVLINFSIFHFPIFQHVLSFTHGMSYDVFFFHRVSSMKQVAHSMSYLISSFNEHVYRYALFSYMYAHMHPFCCTQDKSVAHLYALASIPDGLLVWHFSSTHGNISRFLGKLAISLSNFKNIKQRQYQQLGCAVDSHIAILAHCMCEL